MPNYWAKLWIDVLDDPKMGYLSDHFWRRFFELMLVAKKRDQKGWLPCIRDMAYEIHTTEDDIETVLQALTSVRDLDNLDDPGLVQYIDGRWFITNFEKRQSRVSAAERQRRSRAQRRKEELSRGCHEPVTNRDTETETETETDQNNTTVAAATSVPVNFPEWESYLETVTNHPALVRRMCEVLYPRKEPPSYSFAGKVAKQMGRGVDGYRRLMSLLWEYSSRPPQGDLLPYLLRVHQGKERDNGASTRKRKTSSAPVITGLGKKPDI